ncbi:MAG: type II toxin-antitoxin system Phd/YefM family antitoxin [Chloroflexota bacterium]
MKIASLVDVKTHLSAYLDEAKQNGPVIITRNGKAVAVLIAPLDDDDLERLALSRSPRFQALLDQSRRSVAGGKGLSREEFWKEVGRQDAYIQEETPALQVAEEKTGYKGRK